MSPWSLIFSNCASITPSVSDHKLLCIPCSNVSAHAISCRSQGVLYGSLVQWSNPTQALYGSLVSVCILVLLSGPTQVLYGSLASMWIIYSSLISSHPSPLSMGRLFRCGSPVLLLSGLTQALYGSLVSVWIIYSSLIRSHTSPLWIACFGVDVYAYV
jgi:hypothetical protein